MADPKAPEQCHIRLTDGTLTLVDPNDAADLGRFTWWAWRRAHYVYAHRVVTVHGRKTHFFLHRVVVDALPGIDIDHVNGDGLDNRRCNLRSVDMSRNHMNRHKVSGRSPFKGVSWHAGMGKWRARCGHRLSQKHLGYFASEQDAARAYDAAALQMFGEYACTNESLGLLARRNGTP